MKQLLACTRFELSYYFRALSTWVYFLVMAGVAFLLLNLFGGAFPDASASIGGSDGNVLVNSPFVTLLCTFTVSLFGLLVIAALAGHSGYRDFGAGIHPLIFTTRVSKRTYLASRFIGTLIVNSFVLSGIGFGLWIGAQMPYLDQERLGPSRLSSYLMPYAVFVLPNIVLCAAIFLPLAALTRKRLPHYIGGILLFVGYLVARRFAQDLDDEALSALIDPFGRQSIRNVTEYWTTVEKNTRTVGFTGPVLQNRLLWLTVAGVICAVASWVFRFRHAASERGGARRRTTQDSAAQVVSAPGEPGVAAERSFGRAAAFLQYRSSLRRAFRDVIGNAYFLALLGVGALFLVLGAIHAGEIYGTSVWPVTYHIVDVLGSSFALLLMIVVTFYAGELVWHERDLRVHQLVDSTPMPTWIPYLSKLTALLMVVVALLGIVMATGIVTQAAKGYTNFEIPLYLRSLFVFQLIDYTLFCILAIVIQAVVNHKYVGHFVVILFYGFLIFQGSMGIEHTLFRYASDPGVTYSDMNAYGPFLGPYMWFKLWWGGIAILLAIASNVFWMRGEESRFGWRLELARLRMQRPAALAALVVLALTAGIGGFIYYNTNVLNDYVSSGELELQQARYETRYKAWEKDPQPRITSVDVAADLYPETGELGIRGRYGLRNKTDQPISRIYVLHSTEADVRELSVALPFEETERDEELGVRVLTLAEPLRPGGETELAFDFYYARRGFAHDGESTNIVANGSFVHSNEVAPAIGYSPRYELSQVRDRERHGLAPKDRMRDLDDPEGRKNTYISDDSDWVDFKAVVSTSADQTAVAPGYLQREWTEGDRRYFEYEMDAPILHFYSFLSARYEVARDVWSRAGDDVAIEVYYHPGHDYNVTRMIEAVKASLAYFSEEFSPYQHRQMRILEFPRYAQFAQSFPNTVPYSESIGFIARVGEDDIDYPFYVTAHEVAHQWWAHQVIGANVQGATVLSETLSQYSALMVMEKEYGAAQIRRFLEYELESYLTGRSEELRKELPLMRNENQQYIHYNKGAIAMYCIKDYIGEAALNGALSRYIEAVAFQEPPYTTTRDLLAFLREATPDELQYVIDDLFEHITLFENRTHEARYTKTEDGRYAVTLIIEAVKVRAGELGEETPVPLNDWIDVGVFAEDERTIYLEKHLIEDDTREITITVDEKPVSAGIDPYHKLIDRKPDDNVVEVEEVVGV